MEISGGSPFSGLPPVFVPGGCFLAVACVPTEAVQAEDFAGGRTVWADKTWLMVINLPTQERDLGWRQINRDLC